MDKKQLKKFFQQRLKEADKILKMFQEEFNKAPWNTFTWGDRAIEASEKKKICMTIINKMRVDNFNYETLIFLLTEEVLADAKFNISYDATCSNICKRINLKLKAQILSDLKEGNYYE
jgi:hypothetical protein